MDINTASIYISPPPLNSVEEIVGSNSFRQSKNIVPTDMEYENLPSSYSTICNLNKFVDNQPHQEQIEVDPPARYDVFLL